MASRNPVPYSPQLEIVSRRQWRPSAWSLSRRKHAFDVLGASMILLCVLPVILVVAIAVRLTSAGPVLFRHIRCGKGGRRFEVLKFRTMVQNGSGPNVTRAGDSRVTPLGRFLRKWKLDELPQLINVIRGDMSLVGPRPDVPEYFEDASDEVRGVLNLRPGVTGWASVHFRNEEELLVRAPANRLREFYVQVILPRKAELDLEYAARATAASDLGVLFQTAAAVLPVTPQKETLSS